jgi:transcriptional regulator of acetoin/glycerol metabolism
VRFEERVAGAHEGARGCPLDAAAKRSAIQPHSADCRRCSKPTQMEALERDAIVRSLQDNGGNKQEAARALGMSRATIYRKINDYGIA